MDQGPWIVAQLPTASGNTVASTQLKALRRPADQLSADLQSYPHNVLALDLRIAGHRTLTSL